jgi:hypothetical protein
MFNILSHKENANQNYTKIPSHSSQIHKLIKEIATNAGKDRAKRNSHTLLVEM